MKKLGISLGAVVILFAGGLVMNAFTQPKTTQAEAAVPAFVTNTPTPTPNPYKTQLESSLQQVNQEMINYQDDIVIYQNKYNDLYNSMYNTPGAPTPTPNNCDSLASCMIPEQDVVMNSPEVLLAIYGMNIKTLNSYTNRINNDANYLDQLRQEKDNLEYQISQLGGN